MSAAAPPAGDEHLREEHRRSELLHKGHFLELRRDHVRLPDGGEATRDYVVHPGAVAIVPLLDDGRVLLERQYRYPVGRVMLEIPAGKIDAGEPPLQCAVRELREETGYAARQWAFAARVHNAAAYSTEIIEIWFARDLIPGAQRLDAGEFIELCPLAESELEARAMSGEITDVKTLLALLWLQKWRGGAWPLEWVDTVQAAAAIMKR